MHAWLQEDFFLFLGPGWEDSVLVQTSKACSVAKDSGRDENVLEELTHGILRLQAQAVECLDGGRDPRENLVCFDSCSHEKVIALGVTALVIQLLINCKLFFSPASDPLCRFSIGDLAPRWCLTATKCTSSAGKRRTPIAPPAVGRSTGWPSMTVSLRGGPRPSQWTSPGDGGQLSPWETLYML